MTIYKITAPHAAASRSHFAGGRADEVLQNLRVGNRPSLVGQIPGLNGEMENAFGAGRLLIVKKDDRIMPMRIMLGGSTISEATWDEFGLPAKPGKRQKEQAAGAYEQWRQAEVFAPAAEEPATLAEARTAFNSEFGHFDLSLLNPQTAEEVIHAGHLLQLFAADVLPRDLLSLIDLNYQGPAAPKPLKYELNSKTLKFVNPGNRWDRYLYTKMFLTGLGYAAFYTLSAPDRDIFNSLYVSCEQQGAGLAADPTGLAPGAQISVHPVWHFFADNFMQFHLLGQGMIDRSPNWQLRRQLQEFYSQHFSTVTT
jgi:hypothetical protein